MATNEIFEDGTNLSLPVPTGTKSGEPVRVGDINAVAQTDRNEGATPDPIYNLVVNDNPVGNASCDLKGAFEFEGITFAANIGDPIYITAATGHGVAALRKTDAGDGTTPKYGKALTTKSATSGPLTVLLVQN